MRLSTLLTAILAAAGVRAYTTTNATISRVFTFPPSHFAEAIAVRSNSHLLVTTPGNPELWSINPTASTPSSSVVHSFANGSTPWSVVEVAPDVFAVVTGVWDLATTRAALGSLAVWTVNFNFPGSPKVSFVTKVENSTIINGIARHPTNPLLLLGADSAAGAVWGINLATGAHDILFSSPLLQPTGTVPGTNLGINGLEAAGSHIYFTNSAKAFFGKVPIDLQGHPTGPIATVSSSPEGIVYDDVALDEQQAGVAWIASHPSQVVRIAPGGGQDIISNATLLLNPTAAAFGRGGAKQRRTLYVTNGGEFSGNGLINGGVVAVELQ